MKIQCPRCREVVSISIGGRKRLNLGVKNVIDALRSCGNVTDAAEMLGCSRPYI